MTPCRVFLVGEGSSDIGDLASNSSYREGREGFLQPVVRRLVADVEVEFFDGAKLTTLVGPKRSQPKHWLQRRKASQALALAAGLGADALVFSCDIDKGHEKKTDHERRTRLREIRESIQEGFDHVRQRDGEAAEVMTAVAVPARMIEAWALGDRKALAKLLNMKAATLTYSKPEELWGNGDDPKSSHPKCTWNRITDGQVSFKDIGEEADPDVLRTECPDSFGAFAQDVDKAVAECPKKKPEGRSRR